MKNTFIISIILFILAATVITYGNDLKTLREDAMSGDAASCLELGNCYFYGKGVQEDYYSAFEWYRKAATLNNSAAQFNVALCYDQGIGVKENKFQALEWYRRAAHNGIVQAKFNLAVYYKDGAEFESEGGKVKLEKNIYKAVELFKKAANAQFSPALRELGKLYLKGEGVEKSLNMAISLFKTASAKGDPEGMYLLANYYLYKKDKDYNKIVPLLKASAKSGNLEAIQKLGKLYESGNGVKKSFKKAMKYYQLAAENGLTNSELRLGDYNYYGTNKEIDIWAAKYWYRKAAKKNDPYAQFMLGTFADQGLGEPVNKKLAVSYFSKSAKQGFAKAQYNLATYYKTGTALQASPFLAQYWYRKAALKNDHGAQRELGFYYMTGLAGETDLNAGLNWLNLSQDNGDVKASSYLKSLQLN